MNPSTLFSHLSLRKNLLFLNEESYGESLLRSQT
jgi:hypothetical protein